MFELDLIQREEIEKLSLENALSLITEAGGQKWESDAVSKTVIEDSTVVSGI